MNKAALENMENVEATEDKGENHLFNRAPLKEECTSMSDGNIIKEFQAQGNQIITFEIKGVTPSECIQKYAAGKEKK